MHACNRGPLSVESFRRAHLLPKSTPTTRRRRPSPYPNLQQQKLSVSRSEHSFSEYCRLFANEDDADAVRLTTKKEGRGNADVVLASAADLETAGGEELTLEQQGEIVKQPDQLAPPGLVPPAPVAPSPVTSYRGRLAQVETDLQTVQNDLKQATEEWRTALDAYTKADVGGKGDALPVVVQRRDLRNELAGQREKLLALQDTLAKLAAAEAGAEATAAEATAKAQGGQSAGSATSLVTVEEYAVRQLRAVPRYELDPRFDRANVYHLQLGENRGAMDFPLFLVDEGGVIMEGCKAWLEELQSCWGCAPLATPPAPLFINGLTKTGKTHVMRTVLPALVADHPFFGVRSTRPMLLCNLEMADIAASGTYRGLQEALYDAVHRFAAAAGVLKSSSPTTLPEQQLSFMENAICELVANIDYPVMFLIDEIQSYYEVDKVRQARQFMKRLLLRTSSQAAFAFTGSGMFSFWQNIVATPTHGTLLSAHAWRLDLPSQVGDDAKAAMWAVLKAAQPERVSDEMLPYLVSQPAMMAYVCIYWARFKMSPSAAGTSAREFVVNLENGELLMEAAADFFQTMRRCTPAQRVMLHHLSTWWGVDTTKLWSPLQEYLVPHTIESRGGRSLISDAHKQLIQAVVTPEGELVDLLYISMIAPMAHAAWHSALTSFGEDLDKIIKAAKKTGVWCPGIDWSGPAAHLQTKLQEFAAAPCMRSGGWHTDTWVQFVLQHPDCSATATVFERHRNEGYSKWQLLALYFVMLWHVASHKDTDLHHVAVLFPFGPEATVPKMLFTATFSYRAAIARAERAAQQDQSLTGGSLGAQNSIKAAAGNTSSMRRRRRGPRTRRCGRGPSTRRRGRGPSTRRRGTGPSNPRATANSMSAPSLFSAELFEYLMEGHST